MKKILAFAATAGLLALPAVAWADSISPSSYTDTLGVGGSVTITKQVTIDTAPPTTAPVDVFFLADTTGSMGGSISAVRTGAASIMSSTSGLGDVQFGVGEYKDFGDPYAYRLNTDITANTTAVQNGINLWSASGGGDQPEADLYALDQVANTTSWRSGSTRILVWFGDAYGHNPSGGVSLATASADLQAANIAVQAVDVGTATTGIGGTAGGLQAQSIATDTGGAYFSGIDSTTIVQTITDAITTAITTYNNVSLQAVGNLPGVGVSINPAGGFTGSYDRSITRNFFFDVTFTGLTPGVHSFTIDALLDGGTVATESDRITVGTAVTEPATGALFLAGLMGLGYLRRRNKS